MITHLGFMLVARQWAKRFDHGAKEASFFTLGFMNWLPHKPQD